MFFIYENTLIRLYALSHEVRFFSLLDNECPSEGTDIVVLPGGYPELYASKLSKATKFLVYLKKASVIVYAECGGYMVLSQLILNSEGSWIMFGAFGVISFLTTPTLMLYKYCFLVGNKRGVFFGHEFHYYNEMSRSNQNYVYLIRMHDELKLAGANTDNMFGGYNHCIGSIR
ncbi:Hydrogenobyrinate a,c-diamide synthase [Candidatus Hodgkinia cicadicola]|nr:Hydrogenobyrinate a,c-diamide synthase [Candidatus Hodgkinia cicadicola]